MTSHRIETADAASAQPATDAAVILATANNDSSAAAIDMEPPSSSTQQRPLDDGGKSIDVPSASDTQASQPPASESQASPQPPSDHRPTDAAEEKTTEAVTVVTKDEKVTTAVQAAPEVSQETRTRFFVLYTRLGSIKHQKKRPNVPSLMYSKILFCNKLSRTVAKIWLTC